jgi:hypothetical protein
VPTVQHEGAILYSRRGWILMLGSWFAAAGSVLFAGIHLRSVAWSGFGAFLVLLGGALVHATRDRFSGRRPALDRDGDHLVGAALRAPLPIAGTSFDIRSDNQGGWIVVLHSGGQTLRLAPGGWKVPGEKRFTRAVAEQALLALGLTASPRR